MNLTLGALLYIHCTPNGHVDIKSMNCPVNNPINMPVIFCYWSKTSKHHNFVIRYRIEVIQVSLESEPWTLWIDAILKYSCHFQFWENFDLQIIPPHKNFWTPKVCLLLENKMKKKLNTFPISINYVLFSIGSLNIQSRYSTYLIHEVLTFVSITEP